MPVPSSPGGGIPGVKGANARRSWFDEVVPTAPQGGYTREQYDPSYTPPRGGVVALGAGTPSPGKDRSVDDAAAKQAADAAARARAQTPPPEPATRTIAAEPRAVKMPDGKTVMVSPGSITVPSSFGKDRKGPLAVQGSAPTPDPASEAFWEEVRTGAGGVPLEARGSGFVDVPGGGRMATLSGIENAVARRDYTDARRQEEIARVGAEEGAAVRSAQAGQAIEAAQIDPLEAARIRASGQYGGEQIKARSEMEARLAAADQAQKYYIAADQARAKASKAVDANERNFYQQQAEALERQALAIGAILTGHAPTAQRSNDLLAALGLMSGGGMTPAAATPPQK